MRFRHNIKADPSLQRMYRSFIVDKDRKARSIIERAQEALVDTRRVFDEILASPTETTHTLLHS